MREVSRGEFTWLKDKVEKLEQMLCDHEFQADTQITWVRCKKCKKKYFYEKGVDIYKK